MPESIAFTLWGTDNIKTYGESLAQAGSLAGFWEGGGGISWLYVSSNADDSKLTVGDGPVQCVPGIDGIPGWVQQEGHYGL